MIIIKSAVGKFGLSMTLGPSLLVALASHASPRDIDLTSEHQIMMYRVFAEPLVPIGNSGSSSAEDKMLIEALAQAVTNKWPGALAPFETFIKVYPQSHWASSLRSQLAYAYYQGGLYTPALEHWQEVWEKTKGDSSTQGKRVADFTLAHWTRLLASLGRNETLVPLIFENQSRVLDKGPLSQMWARTREAVGQMQRYPGETYKCGTFALNAVAHEMQIKYDEPSLLQIPSPPSGFKLSTLQDISKTYGLNLIAVRKQWNAEIPVPSVVHWKQNHYAAILNRSGDLYKVSDPTFGYPRMMTAETINSESSGEFLVPLSQVASNLSPLSIKEADQISGKGNPGQLADANDLICTNCYACPPPNHGGPGGGPPGDGPPGRRPLLTSTPQGSNDPETSSCNSCQNRGMPNWLVSEPYINIWLDDEPLGYQPAIGPRVSFRLTYKQRREDMISSYSRVGANWSCSWLSAINLSPYGLQFPVVADFIGGGALTFENSLQLATNYYTNAKLQSFTNSAGALTNIAIYYPDGSVDNFGHLVPGNIQWAYLSQRISPEGYVTSFLYDDSSGETLLKYVIDANGGTNSIGYSTNYPTDGISTVTDPYGRSIQLLYDENANLTNIVDVANISSSFIYDNNGWLTNLTTPYGTTSFQPIDYELNNVDERDRNVTITQPDGGKHLFAFVQYPTTEPTAFAASLVPTNTPIGTLDNAPNRSDSYYWDPRQYALLSTNNVLYMSSSDFLFARMQHWLGYGSGNMDTLSISRSPSLDGSNFGQLTWYDYVGKPPGGTNYLKGANILPSVVAQVLPDGSTWYTFVRRNSAYLVTNFVGTYSLPTGAIGLRTNSYIYDSNNIDLLKVIGPDNASLAYYSYNTHHQVIYFTNAVNDWSSNCYNSFGQLMSRRSLTGLTTTNTYFTSGAASNRLQQTTDLEINRVNSYTYTNGLVYTHTNERGLTVTNTWDNFQRLIRTDYPDGTYITNTYVNLDMVRVKDRIGFSTSYGYDQMRRLTDITNALGQVTQYFYCTCGALNSIQDSAGNSTLFFYDPAGRLTNAVYADGFGITNRYDPLGRLTNTWDSAGTSITNWFNNQGLCYGVSNSFGCTENLTFDIYDRITNNLDVNCINVGIAYDALGRPISRAYPDSGTERFGYSAAGLVAFTNQLNFPSYYCYDPAGRRIFETNANLELTQFQFSPAGDLTNLVDAKLHSTRWDYDQYGRVTNKVDAANNSVLRYIYDANDRLTNRWTPSKGTTVYRYDPLGNLTNVIYPVNTALVLAYDCLNRLTNMVDGIGTTTYSYDANGQMISEDGPWVDDSVIYTYTNRLRATLNVLRPNASAWIQTYAYDTANRLRTVASPAGSFGYAYDSARHMQWNSLNLPNNAYITNTFDSLARLVATVLKNSTNGLLNSHQYGYDLAGEPNWRTNTFSDYHAFLYDKIGQVVVANGYESTGMSRLQEQAGYSYDAAHNLNWRTNNAFWENFSVNNLNQLSSISRSGANLTVAGTTTSSATNVTVNGLSANSYADHTFALGGFSIVSGNNSFTAIAQDALNRKDTNSITVNLPASLNYTYDQNGNLLGDGNKSFAYDDENQLTSVWVTNVWRSDFAYDGKKRRRLLFESTWNGSAWITNSVVRYVYDGNLVIQERDANNLPLVQYTRGRDLSGTLQGAGGIGGLLALSQLSTIIPQHFYYHADGNGNITALINAAQAVSARYIYDSYGNTLSEVGPMADANPYRFSSKEWHPSSAMYYYLYRFYAPELQRWINEDPITDNGFRVINREVSEMANREGEINLYGFVQNDPIRNFDILGLKLGTISICIVFDPIKPGGNVAIIVGYTPTTRSEQTRQRCCNAVRRLLPPCANIFDIAAATAYFEKCLLSGK